MQTCGLSNTAPSPGALSACSKLLALCAAPLPAAPTACSSRLSACGRRRHRPGPRASASANQPVAQPRRRRARAVFGMGGALCHADGGPKRRGEALMDGAQAGGASATQETRVWAAQALVMDSALRPRALVGAGLLAPRRSGLMRVGVCV